MQPEVLHHQNEEARLADLYALEILDSETEKEFDELVTLASEIAGVPIALISLIDRERQWFKSKIGIDVDETPRVLSFCTHAIASNQDVYLIEDTLKGRFADHEMVVQAPHIRFYAGFPLRTIGGNRIGSLCVVDHQPRSLTPRQVELLTMLSHQVMKLMEMRINKKNLLKLRDADLKQKQQLQKLVDHQRKLMTILAHDTRGPMSSMRELLLLFLRNEVSSTEVTMLYKMMLDQTEVSIDMIDNLVRWSEIHLRQELMQVSSQSLAEITTQVYTQFSLAASAKNNTLVHDIEIGAKLLASEDMLSFVVRNLINNAIKYTENGSITLSGRNLGDQYMITIADTGMGMSATTRELLFQGKIASKKGTRNEQGTGLGLMLIRDFIEASGGSISVESEINKGTTFIIALPCIM